MTATATGMLNVCRSQIGYREAANNNNKYGIWYGMNYQPYCAMGLSWAANEAGCLDIMHGKFAFCPTWVNAWKNAGQWHDYTGAAQPGDIVFFDWSGNHSYAQHVGIVESIDSGVFVTIEFNTTSGIPGNQSDGEGVWRRRRSQLYVVGFGRPAYAAQSSPVPLPASRSASRTTLPLIVDGVWGRLTTMALQRWLGVPADGVLGPRTRRALQRRLNVTSDGAWGPITRKALQRFLHVTPDGIWGPVTVKALQRFLNRNL